MSFDLLHKPFIHVVHMDDRTERLGILPTLSQAGQIADLRHPNPPGGHGDYESQGTPHE
jgi:hypothetical protein